MAFSDLTAHASRRFFLVRISPARNITPGLADQGGGIYEKGDWGQKIAGLTRNSTTLTQVFATPSSNDEWWHDTANNKLVVKLASAPDSDTNVLIAVYRLYFTGERARTELDSPLDTASSSNTLQNWEPRLTGGLRLVSSAKNILSGLLTTSQSAITILNQDRYFQQWLTSIDSFNRRDVDIWLGIGDTSNADKIYSGIVSEITMGETVTLVV